MDGELVIRVPTSLHAVNAARFSAGLPATPHASRYVINMEGLGHVSPFGMLLTAKALRDFLKLRQDTNPKAEFLVAGSGDNDYAGHMGFYQSFGLDSGKHPGEAPGSRTYVPITELTREELYARADAENEHVVDYLEEESWRLAGLLLRQSDGDAVASLAYSIREMMRNCLEHSDTDRIWIAGQYWQSYDRVEVAILDEGCGVRASLASERQYRYLSSHEAALEKAMEEGVSAGIRLGVAGDPYANQGVGLPMTAAICLHAGEFSIASGDAVLLRASGARHRSTTCNLAGTAVRLVMDTSAIPSLDDIKKATGIRTSGRSGSLRRNSLSF